MKKKAPKMSRITAMHFVKLIFRSLLLLGATAVYVINRIKDSEHLFGGYENTPWLPWLICVIFTAEMALRFFPSRLESPGCQKQFARNYIPSGEATPSLGSGVRTFSVAAAWIGLNAIFGVLYFTKIIDAGILVLLALAYSVCDMICILFFCPFQTWFMKNRCCTDCRIYNWDFAMMFTPLVFIPRPYAWTLLGFSLLLLLRWEITRYRHPERFSEATNKCIRCENCKEKLCHHKKQIRKFLQKHTKKFK